MLSHAGRQIFREAPMLYSALQSMSSLGKDQNDGTDRSSPPEQYVVPQLDLNRILLPAPSNPFLAAQPPRHFELLTPPAQHVDVDTAPVQQKTDEHRNLIQATLFTRAPANQYLFATPTIQETQREDILSVIMPPPKPHAVIIPGPDAQLTEEAPKEERKSDNNEKIRLALMMSHKPNPLAFAFTTAINILQEATTTTISNPEDLKEMVQEYVVEHSEEIGGDSLDNIDTEEDPDKTLPLEQQDQDETAVIPEEQEDSIGGDSVDPDVTQDLEQSYEESTAGNSVYIQEGGDSPYNSDEEIDNPDNEETWVDEDTEEMEEMEDLDETIPKEDDDGVGADPIDRSSNITGDESLIPEDEKIDFDPDGDGAMNNESFENQGTPPIDVDPLDSDKIREITEEQSTLEISGGDSIDLSQNKIPKTDKNIPEQKISPLAQGVSSSESDSDSEELSSTTSYFDSSEFSNDDDSISEEEQEDPNSQSADQNLTQPLETLTPAQVAEKPTDEAAPAIAPADQPEQVDKEEQDKNPVAPVDNSLKEQNDQDHGSQSDSFRQKKHEKQTHSSNYYWQRVGALFVVVASTCLYLYFRSRSNDIDLSSALQKMDFSTIAEKTPGVSR